MLSKRPEERFADQSRWTPETYQDRREDIEAVINDVSHSHEVDGVKADISRLGLAGHSLGGYTVLGLAGAWPSWKDPRVKAVLAMSPYCTPFVAHGDLSQMNVPVMYQGGTSDAGITPTVKGPDGAYAKTGGQKFFVDFRGAGHLAWTDLNKRYQDEIDRYSVAFFNRYLKGGDNHGELLSLMEQNKAKPRQVAEVETDVQGNSGHGPRK
jgi:predicted dienelactone hydrolase